jgi:hypothetical protein
MWSSRAPGLRRLTCELGLEEMAFVDRCSKLESLDAKIRTDAPLNWAAVVMGVASLTSLDVRHHVVNADLIVISSSTRLVRLTITSMWETAMTTWSPLSKLTSLTALAIAVSPRRHGAHAGLEQLRNLRIFMLGYQGECGREDARHRPIVDHWAPLVALLPAQCTVERGRGFNNDRRVCAPATFASADFGCDCDGLPGGARATIGSAIDGLLADRDPIIDVGDVSSDDGGEDA